LPARSARWPALKRAPAALEVDTNVLKAAPPSSESTPGRPETTPSTAGVHVGFLDPYSAASDGHAGRRGVNAAPSRRTPPTLGPDDGRLADYVSPTGANVGCLGVPVWDGGESSCPFDVHANVLGDP